MAQQYATPVPAPRTTSVPQLRELAHQHAIAERFHRGIAFEQGGNYAAAAGEFEAALKLDLREPQHSTALYDLGIAYANLGRLDEAATAFRQALDGDSGFLAAMANLIAVDITRGDLREARRVSDRFVALAPDSARALYERGITALRQNDVATARASFSTLLRNDPSYAVAHYNLAATESAASHWADAERELRLALDLAPNYARARFALGTVLLHLGRKGEARAAFDRVSADANGDTALANLARSLRDAIPAP